jgi:prephenate dehydrogenase
MTVAITIVGMNRIGASIGLALASQKHQLTRTGIDREPGKTQQAHKMGAVDETSLNLEKTVAQADVVILCVPLHELKENLEIILPALKPEAVVLDTSPLQVQVFDWAKPLLPAGRFFLTLYPTLNPDFLLDTSTSLGDANADLFKGGLCVISSLPRTSEGALNLAADLASLLGAKPYFADPYEVDGLLGMVHLLPRLTAAALASAAFEQPGWLEARKLTGPAFAAITAPLELEAESYKPGLDAIHNRENALRLLDLLISTLQDVRSEIADGDAEALHNRFAEARTNRNHWLGQRKTGEWGERPTPEIPAKSSMLGRMFGLGKKPKAED